MGYCSNADVGAEFKKIDITASTLVTTDDISAFIVEADQIINSYVRQRYTLPIVDADGLVLLKFICRTLVAERVKGILRSKQAQNTTANQDTRDSSFSKTDLLKMLTQIAKGEIALGNAASAVSGGPFKSYNVANSVEPVFEKDTRQW